MSIASSKFGQRLLEFLGTFINGLTLAGVDNS